MAASGPAAPDAPDPPGAAEAPAARVPALGALSYPEFRLLWAGGIFSTVGQQMQSAVNLWVVYELSHSPLELGLTGVFQAIPLFLFSLIGGTVADAVDRRRLLMLTQALRILPALALFLLSSSGVLAVWHIYAVTLLSTSLSVFDRPARHTLMIGMVPQSHITNAVSFSATTNRLTFMLGPTIAGLLLAWTSAETSYGANLLLYGVAWLTVLTLKSSGVAARSRGGLLAMAGEGFSYVMGSPMILAMFVTDLLANCFGSFQRLLPIFATEVFGVGPEGFGILYAAPSVGALLGSTGVMLLGNVERKGAAVLLGLFLYGAGLIAFGLSSSFGLSLLLAIALGFVDQVQATIRNAFVLSVTPREMWGRVESIRAMFTFTGPSLGSAQAGVMTALLGSAPLAVMVGGVVVMGTVAAAHLRVPRLWAMRGDGL